RAPQFVGTPACALPRRRYAGVRGPDARLRTRGNFPKTSRSDSRRTSTIRRTWTRVVQYGGISTITSPTGRVNTPRRAIASHTRMPARSPRSNNWRVRQFLTSSTPAIRPTCRISPTFGDCQSVSSNRRQAGSLSHSAKPRHHLVRNQLRAIAARNVGHPAQPTHGLRNHSRRALNQRLHDHCGVGIAAFFPGGESLFHLADALPFAPAVLARVGALGFRSIERATIAIRRHRRVRFEQQSSVRFMKQIDVTQTDRAHGVAVIGAVEREKLWLFAATRTAGGFVGELERDFHRGRTIVGEKDFGEGDRGKR